MDIAFGGVRQFVVDDVGHVVDVDAARRDVGGDQHTRAPVAEILKGPLARILRLVSVYGLRADAAAGKVLHDLVGTMLRSGKDDNFLEFRGREQLD